MKPDGTDFCFKKDKNVIFLDDIFEFTKSDSQYFHNLMVLSMPRSVVSRLNILNLGIRRDGCGVGIGGE